MVTVDINALASFYAKTSFAIINVKRAIIEPGKKSFGVLAPPYSGLLFPLHGQARIFFDNTPYELEPGKVFHCGSNMPLNKEVAGRSLWDLIVIYYQVLSAAPETLCYAQLHYELDPGYNPRITDMLERIYRLAAIPGNLPTLSIKSLFFTVMDEVLTCAANRRPGARSDLIQRIVEYINSHYMEPLTIPELAKQYGLNSKQLAYLFKKHIGTSPNDYLIEYRLDRARELLSTTNYSVGEISNCVGYSDANYFSKLFKMRTGLSPSMLQPSRKAKNTQKSFS